jgi:hypothetical protein
MIVEKQPGEPLADPLGTQLQGRTHYAGTLA